MCWSQRRGWVVPARGKHEQLQPLDVIHTVNALIEGTHPPGDYAPQEILVAPHLRALLAGLEQKGLLGSMTRPLGPTVLASWDGVVNLYYELADKLLTAKRPELACQVLATALEHNRDFIYDLRWMEALEMSALLAGDTELPILRLPASAVLTQVKTHREHAKPLPAIARGYSAMLFNPVFEEADWKLVSDPVVDQPLPSLTNEVEFLWEGVNLSRAFSPELPQPSPDVELFTQSAILEIQAKWRRLNPASRRRVDEFSMRITGAPLSKILHLPLGTEP